MSQTQTLLRILHRTEKSAVAMIEREFERVTMAPEIAKVYEQKQANVAALEKRLGKGSG